MGGGAGAARLQLQAGNTGTESESERMRKRKTNTKWCGAAAGGLVETEKMPKQMSEETSDCVQGIRARCHSICRPHQCSIPKAAGPSRSITTSNRRSTTYRWRSNTSRRTTVDKTVSRTTVHLGINNQSSSSSSSSSNSLPTNGHQRQRLWDMETNPSKVLHPS